MYILLIIVPLIVAADQYTKWLVRQHIELHDRLVVIDGFFNLTHVQNPGAAFGLFSDLEPSIRTPLFSTFSIIAFIVLLLLYRRTPDSDWKGRTVLALIAGGAIGNITDRLFFGTVTDFLQVYYKQYYWPSFNVADSCISIGVCLLFILMFFSRDEDFFLNPVSSPKQVAEDAREENLEIPGSGSA